MSFSTFFYMTLALLFTCIYTKELIERNTVYEAIQNNQIEKGEMDKDIYDFLQLPIPNAIWEEVKMYHNKQFIDYIDELLSKHRRVSKNIHLWD